MFSFFLAGMDERRAQKRDGQTVGRRGAGAARRSRRWTRGQAHQGEACNISSETGDKIEQLGAAESSWGQGSPFAGVLQPRVQHSSWSWSCLLQQAEIQNSRGETAMVITTRDYNAKDSTSAHYEIYGNSYENVGVADKTTALQKVKGFFKRNWKSLLVIAGGVAGVVAAIGTGALPLVPVAATPGVIAGFKIAGNESTRRKNKRQKQIKGKSPLKAIEYHSQPQQRGGGALTQPLGRGALAQPLGRGALAQPLGGGALTQPLGRGALAQPLGRGALAQQLGGGALTQQRPLVAPNLGQGSLYEQQRLDLLEQQSNQNLLAEKHRQDLLEQQKRHSQDLKDQQRLNPLAPQSSQNSLAEKHRQDLLEQQKRHSQDLKDQQGRHELLALLQRQDLLDLHGAQRQRASGANAMLGDWDSPDSSDSD